MRSAWVALACAACARTGTPTFFEAQATGVVDGRPVELSMHLDDGGHGGLAARNGSFVAEASEGRLDAWTDARSPRATVSLPAVAVLAGARQVPFSLRIADGFELATDSTRSVAIFSFDGAHMLEDGDERVATFGAWAADLYFPRGELHFKGGKFQVVARCNELNRDPRVCGKDGAAGALARLAYNDCPGALTKPYMEKLTGDAPFTCAGGLCGSDSWLFTGACTWHRVALWDRAGTQLTLAGFPDSDCGRDTRGCNAGR